MTVAQETANFGRQLSLALTEAGVTAVRCGGAATSWTSPGSAPSTPAT